jgi:hypothetical protein
VAAYHFQFPFHWQGGFSVITLTLHWRLLSLLTNNHNKPMTHQQNIFNLAYRYTRALSRWIKAGRPVRSEAEITRIFETFCEPCKDYDAKNSLCRHCACRVNRQAAAPLNKIAMATEECLLGKWDTLERQIAAEKTEDRSPTAGWQHKTRKNERTRSQHKQEKYRMTRTAEENTIYPVATCDNTVFITVAAYKNHKSKTEALRKSAEDQGVPLVIYDKGEPWQSFYHHKIERMSEHLEQQKERGKHFVFILDGREIFNHDMPGKVWPSHKDYLARGMEEAVKPNHVRLNAGMIVAIQKLTAIPIQTQNLKTRKTRKTPALLKVSIRILHIRSAITMVRFK